MKCKAHHRSRQAFSGVGVSPLCRCAACPALKGPVEGAEFGKAQFVGDVLERQAGVADAVQRQVAPHRVDDVGVAAAVLLEPPSQLIRTAPRLNDCDFVMITSTAPVEPVLGPDVGGELTVTEIPLA